MQDLSCNTNSAACYYFRNNIIGCECCVNVWYSYTDALKKSYPSCRGYSETVILRAIDEFLVEAKKIQQAMVIAIIFLMHCLR